MEAVAGFLGGACSGDSVHQVALGQLQQPLPSEETQPDGVWETASIHHVRVPGLSGGYSTTGSPRQRYPGLLDPFIGLALWDVRGGVTTAFISMFIYGFMFQPLWSQDWVQMSNMWSRPLRRSKVGEKANRPHAQ